MRFLGKTYTRRELMKRAGDISQICGVRQSVLDDGPGRGMRVLDVNTGGSLSFSVLPDRGMDIGWCRYNNIPVGFISKAGPVSPALAQHGGDAFLRSFTAGLLTTCGYTHMGAPCVDLGTSLGLHGRAHALVADNTAATCRWEGDAYVMTLRGTMREASALGENLQLTREIRAEAGEDRFGITDEVENCGYDPQPLMILYHFNFGFPLVGPDTKLISSPCRSVAPRDGRAAMGLEQCSIFSDPVHGFAEQVFYHDLEPEADGTVFAGLHNPALPLNVKIRFQRSELPYLVEWKQMGEGDYVCGIEPATWKPEGRAKAREQGELLFIQPGETRIFHLELIVENQ